jgi:hypothetical protein
MKNSRFCCDGFVLLPGSHADTTTALSYQAVLYFDLVINRIQAISVIRGACYCFFTNKKHALNN